MNFRKWNVQFRYGFQGPESAFSWHTGFGKGKIQMNHAKFLKTKWFKIQLSCKMNAFLECWYTVDYAFSQNSRAFHADGMVGLNHPCTVSWKIWSNCYWKTATLKIHHQIFEGNPRGAAVENPENPSKRRFFGWQVPKPRLPRNQLAPSGRPSMLHINFSWFNAVEEVKRLLRMYISLGASKTQKKTKNGCGETCFFMFFLFGFCSCWRPLVQKWCFRVETFLRNIL